MKIEATSVASSVADADYEDLAYLHFRGKEGYFFSLSRQAESTLIEVMIQDQVNCKTTDIQAKLSAKSLLVVVPDAMAAHLSGETEFEVVFADMGGNIQQLHEALCAIFSGVGSYENAL